jgi:hypothetical protein
MSDKAVEQRHKALSEQIEAEKARITSRYDRQFEAMKSRMSQELASVDQRFEKQVTQLERAKRIVGNLGSKSVN